MAQQHAQLDAETLARMQASIRQSWPSVRGFRRNLQRIVPDVDHDQLDLLCALACFAGYAERNGIAAGLSSLNGIAEVLRHMDAETLAQLAGTASSHDGGNA